MITRRARAVVWGLLAAPAVWLVASYLRGVFSYGETIIWSGRVSAALMLLAVLVTPLRSMFGRVLAVQALLLHRRALGVASFAYAALHLAVYVERKADIARIAREAMHPELATGWVAFLIMLPLALTSNNRSVRALGRRWKTLHKSVHLGTLILFVHWCLATALLAPAVAALVLVAVLQGWRVVNPAR